METDNAGVLGGNGRIAGDLTFAGSYFLPGNAPDSGTSVGTLTLSGNLTLAAGPSSQGPKPSAFLLDLDPQASDPSRRSDLVLLTAPSAVIALPSVTLGLFLKSPPSPGQVLRFLSAPNAANAVVGTFSGLPNGSTIASDYFGVSFAFVVQYGSNYVQLVHQNAPAMSYAYLRTFYFNAEQLSDPAISGPLGQFRSNGIPNVLAYALGLDPRTATATGLPRAEIRSVTGVPYPVLELRRAFPRRPDVVYRVAESTDVVVQPRQNACLPLEVPGGGRAAERSPHEF